MASAAWYTTGRSQTTLQQLKSEVQEAHNPLGICLVLVTGSSRALDRRILAPRLKSLGASLISVRAWSWSQRVPALQRFWDEDYLKQPRATAFVEWRSLLAAW